MTSHMNHLVAVERIADYRRTAERSRVAAAAMNGTRRERTVRLPSLRANRGLMGLRKRLNLA
jgi:hypothetical protein